MIRYGARLRFRVSTEVSFWVYDRVRFRVRLYLGLVLGFVFGLDFVICIRTKFTLRLRFNLKLG